MKKIILFMLMLLLPVSVRAESNISSSVSEDIVSINIELSEKGKAQPVSLQVYAENGAINFADIIYTNKDGKALAEYKNNGATGIYTWKVYANSETYQGTFKFFDSAYRNEMISEFNDLVKISGSLTQYAEKYKDALGLEEAIAILKVDNEGKNPMLDSIALKNAETAESTEQIKSYVKAVIFSSVAQETKSGAKMKELLNINAFSDYLNFVLYNEKPLLEELNADIQNSFYSRIAQMTAVEEKDVKEALKNALLISAAENAALASELEKALDIYSKNGWINLSSSVDKNKATASLVGEKFDSIKAIESKYNSYNASSSDIGGGGSSSSGGQKGSGSSGGHISIVPSENNGTIFEQKQIFSDVELTMWAAEPIRKAVEAGILTGVGDGKFNPGGELTRAQAAVILCRMAGVSESASSKAYNDVKPSDWYAGYVNSAVNEGIFFGMTENEFGANISLSREQAAAVFWRYLKNREFSAKEQDMVFEDDAEISDWAKEAVYSLVSLGVISGKTDKLFCPKKPLLRSETAVIITKISEVISEGSALND